MIVELHRVEIASRSHKNLAHRPFSRTRNRIVTNGTPLSIRHKRTTHSCLQIGQPISNSRQSKPKETEGIRQEIPQRSGNALLIGLTGRLVPVALAFGSTDEATQPARSLVATVTTEVAAGMGRLNHYFDPT